MADGFIVRKGGVAAEQAATPTITEVSVTTSSITFTIKNNDAASAVILWEVGDTTPDANSLELAAGATSSNLTVTGLDDDETYIVYATANVTGKIKSEVASASITTDEILVYTAATGGTTEEYDLDSKRYKSHTFTSDGTFTVTTVGNGDRNAVDYLIIAGGGGGGGGLGAGGGAGGYRTTITPVPGNENPDAKVVVTAQAYSIDVGSGGTAGGNNATGGNGDNSSALGRTSTGGGAGGGETQPGENGGSGGGSGNYSTNNTAGTGITGQGNDGGINGIGAPDYAQGGGGGAGQVGQNGVSGGSPKGGDGGDGLANTLRNGTSETRAGGGGAAGFGSTAIGIGGTGGGGDGATNTTGPGVSGSANTGSGGGGGPDGGSTSGGAGGNGIVIIRYEIEPSV